ANTGESTFFNSFGPERSGSMIMFTRDRGQGSKSLRLFDPGNVSGAIPPGKQIQKKQTEAVMLIDRLQTLYRTPNPDKSKSEYYSVSLCHEPHESAVY